ncbi:hypothetical protein [Pseudactinotalea sp.]|uniref:hypothetical protein n=1 Tax=Pseudactinotalea sp. TaxID=1926260 RepID=UPI003B3AB464
MSVEYRIEYTIQRTVGDPEEQDFEDIGFGSSGGWADPDQAAYMLTSAIQTGGWETEHGMPDPDEVLAAIQRAREEDPR